MRIQSTDLTITAGSSVKVVLADKGSAHVSMTLVIGGLTAIRHEDTYTGSLTTELPIPAGTYECTYVEIAYKTGAQGPTYDSKVTFNGKPAAWTKGSIPTSSDSDYASAKFELVVE